MLPASTAIFSLVVGTSTVKSANSKLPCLNSIKNPVLALPGPDPSFLYTNPNWLPGTGGSSYMFSLFLKAVLTISKFTLLLATVLENENKGTSVFAVRNLYCSVGMPCMVADP